MIQKCSILLKYFINHLYFISLNLINRLGSSKVRFAEHAV